MPELTEQMIEEFRRLESGATKGPWHLEGPGDGWGMSVAIRDASGEDGCIVNSYAIGQWEPDAALIVFLRNHAPALLAKIDELECTLSDEEAAHQETLRMLETERTRSADLERLREAVINRDLAKDALQEAHDAGNCPKDEYLMRFHEKTLANEEYKAALAKLTTTGETK